MKWTFQTVFALSLASSVAFAEKAEFAIDVDARPIAPENGLPVVSYADVLEEATPAVVAVYTARIVTAVPGRMQPGVPELFRQFGLPVPRQAISAGEKLVQRQVSSGTSRQWS